MKHLLFTLLLCFAFGTFTNAQNYKSAIGLRLGVPLSVSYKTFISEPGAIEVFAGLRGYTFYRWFTVGGLYEHHKPISELEGLSWYFGGGAAAYFWSFDDTFLGGADNSSTSFAILGTLGLDYKFQKEPVNLSIDWVPAFSLNGYGNGFAGGYGALSARYVFKSNK
jgi:hypothetical protein